MDQTVGPRALAWHVEVDILAGGVLHFDERGVVCTNNKNNKRDQTKAKIRKRTEKMLEPQTTYSTSSRSKHQHQNSHGASPPNSSRSHSKQWPKKNDRNERTGRNWNCDGQKKIGSDLSPQSGTETIFPTQSTPKLSPSCGFNLSHPASLTRTATRKRNRVNHTHDTTGTGTTARLAPRDRR